MCVCVCVYRYKHNADKWLCGAYRKPDRWHQYFSEATLWKVLGEPGLVQALLEFNKTGSFKVLL